jgi:hypothetical protein
MGRRSIFLHLYSSKRFAEYTLAFETFIPEINHCLVSIQCRQGPDDVDVLGVFEKNLIEIFSIVWIPSYLSFYILNLPLGLT